MNKERLLRLADHLEGPEENLLHEQFDFSFVNYSGNGSKYERMGIKDCGSHGCAIGELPIVFPELEITFQFSSIWPVHNQPSYTLMEVYQDFSYLGGKYGFATLAQAVFDLSIFESLMLFAADHSLPPAPWQAVKLTVTATRFEVADSIRQFVAWKEVQAAVVEQATPEEVSELVPA